MLNGFLNSNCTNISIVAILTYFPFQIIKSSSKNEFSLGNEQTSYLLFSKKAATDFSSTIHLKKRCALKLVLYNG